MASIRANDMIQLALSKKGITRKIYYFFKAVIFVSFMISDSKKQEKEKRVHQGLTNIQLRAESLGGKLVIEKSKETFELGDGVISQSDITKLKLGLSDTLSNIADLEYDLHIARLDLGKLINRELKSNSEIGKVDPFPVKFVYNNFEDFLRANNFFSKTKKQSTDIAIPSNKESVRLSEANELILYNAFITIKTSNAKLMIGKKNRKITRALLITEAANYDFGIGNPEALFEALIIYTRVFSSYLDSVYTFNLAVANLEKLKDSTYKSVDKLN